MTEPKESLPIKHSVFSPSTAHIWSRCPGSAVLSSKVAEPPPSDWMLEGTKAHKIAEFIVNEWLRILKMPFPHTEVERESLLSRFVETLLKDPEDAEIVTNVMTYVRVVQEQLQAFDDFPKGFNAKTEHQLFLDKEFNLFGTCDFFATGLKDGVPYGVIIDLKYGAGVPVKAYANLQLCYYAEALRRSSKKQLKKVKVIVVQPRFEEWFSEVEYSDIELAAWGQALHQFADKAAQQFLRKPENIELTPGDHCKWCKARGTCSAYKKDLEAKAGMSIETVDELDVVPYLTPAAIARILDVKTKLEDFLDAVKKHAIQQILEGEDIPGYKVIEGRSVRRWRGDCDAKEWEETIRALGVDPLTKPEPRSVAQIEKEVGKENFKQLERFVIKPQGAPTIARRDDSREGIDVRSDFA